MSAPAASRFVNIPRFAAGGKPIRSLFCFRKFSELSVKLGRLSCTIVGAALRLAQNLAAVGSTRAAIGSYGGWNHQGAQEKCSCGED